MKELSQFSHNESYRQYFREEIIPTYYYGRLHVLINGLLLLGIIFFSCSKIEAPTFFQFLLLPLMLVVGNIAVFIIHRYILHRKISFFPYAYKIHTQMHHQFFTDEHIVYRDTRDFYILFFPPEVVIVFSFVFCPMIFFMASLLFSFNVAYFLVLGAAIYFILYEVFHFISHLPLEHFLLKFPLFFYMREHHRHHHNPKLMRDYNFNIVYPLCDFIFKTYYHKKSKGQ